MSKNKTGGDKRIAKIALITALLSLITQLVELLERIIEWLTKQ